MNRKSKKRLSILKKAVPSEDSSPTFTKLNRRISFSGKKSIKEFSCDDNKVTIWGNSYEESAEMVHSHHTVTADSTLASQSYSSANQKPNGKPQNLDKENELINLRTRTILKRKSNVLKAIQVKATNSQTDILPNIETVEMDISVNDNDSKPSKPIPIVDFPSPNKINNSHTNNDVPDNVTPVPPHKITKFNLPNESPVVVPKSDGRRISDELPSDSCMMATTYDASNYSIPSRILEKGDINLTYGFNMSEFDLLKKKTYRPSESRTSFATKIDQINFSNEEDEELKNNSFMLKIQNPQIEQMKLTGTIVTATDKSLDISIEITDSSKALDNLRQTVVNEVKETYIEKSPPPSPQLPKGNTVLEMFNIQNQLKWQTTKQLQEKFEMECFVPFTPAKFETPNMKYLDATKDREHPNDKIELPKVTENIKRQTILFAKNDGDIDVSMSMEGDYAFQNVTVDKSKKTSPAVWESMSNELDMSMLDKSNVNPLMKYLLQRTIDQSTKSSDRDTKYLPNNDFEVVECDSFEDHIKNIEYSSGIIINKENPDKLRRTIHFPNEEIEISTMEPVQHVISDGKNLNVNKPNKEQEQQQTKRDTIYFPHQAIETSIVNEPIKLQNAHQPKRDTIHFQNKNLEISTIEENAKGGIKSLNSIVATKAKENYERLTKRGTIHFRNHDLEISSIEVDPKVKIENKNLNLLVTAKVNEKLKNVREAIHLPNNELEISIDEGQSSSKVTENPIKRTTINYPNEELSKVKLTSDDKGYATIINETEEAIVGDENKSKTKRETIYFSNQEVETSMMIETTKVSDEQQTKRGTINYPNQELEISSVEPSSLSQKHDSKTNNKRSNKSKKSSTRGTICFPNKEMELSQELEMSQNAKYDSKSYVLTEEVNDEHKPQTKRGTIHFPNQELETSMVEPSKICDVNEAQTKRGTIHYSNQELEVSSVVPSPSKKRNTNNSKKSTRGTVCFSNKEMELSAIELCPNEILENSNLNVNLPQDNVKRGTIHFPNQELQMSQKQEAKANQEQKPYTKRGTIHFPNQELETTMVDESSKICDENEAQTKPDTIHYSNQQLEVSSVEPAPSKKCNSKTKRKRSNKSKKSTTRGTICFPNKDIELSSIELSLNETVETSNLNLNLPANNVKRSTIHFPNEELEMSQNAKYESKKNCILTEEPNVNDDLEAQTNRGTIHFPNLELETSMVTEPSEICDVKHGTIHYRNQELEVSSAEPSPSKKCDSKTNNKRSNKSKKSSTRGTILFPSKEMELSTIDLCPNEIVVDVKRETIHFPSQELDISQNAEDVNENYKALTKRGTIHFPNQKLDTSMAVEPLKNANEAQTKRGTIHFPNQQLEMSTVKDSNLNESSPRLSKIEDKKKKTSRGTLHFTDHVLEMSTVEPAMDIKKDLPVDTKLNEIRKRLTQQGTINFQHQQIEMSVVESNVVSNINEKCGNRGTILVPSSIEMSMIEPSPNLKNAKCNESPKRGTIYFPNQEIENSLVNESIKSKSLTNRNTIHFPNNELDISMADAIQPDISIEELERETNHFKNLDISDENDKVDTAESKSLKRGTIHFHDTNHLDISSVTKNQITKSNELPSPNQIVNRGTIYFENETLDASMTFGVSQNKPKNNISSDESNGDSDSEKYLDCESPVRSPSNDFDMSVTESNLNTSETRKTYPATPVHCKKIGLSIDEARELYTVQPQPLVPGSIYYVDKTLDLSVFDIKNTQHNVDRDSDTSEIEQKIESMKQPARSTIYFSNQSIDTSKDAEKLDTSTVEMHDALENQQMGAIPKLIRPDNNCHTIRYQNQEIESTLTPEMKYLVHDPNIKSRAENMGKYRETIHFVDKNLDHLDISDQQVPDNSRSAVQYTEPQPKELDEKRWGGRNISHHVNDKTNPNMEDLNMTNDFDQNHIKTQSTMTNLDHIVKFLSEKRKNGEQHEMSDTINLDHEEMDLSSYKEPDKQLANDLSGLKLFGQDSTYFENNTEVLCNLDPKRIFCESKYYAMNTAASANSKHENVTLTSKRSFLPVPIRPPCEIPSQPNISTHQLHDENSLQDIVPRFYNCKGSVTIPELFEITANLTTQNKTRQELCNDYINLTISRFSSSFANSSNIDQTSIKLVESLGDTDEDGEEKVEIQQNDNEQHGIKYVRVEEANQAYQNVDKMFTCKKTTHVPILDLTKCHEHLNQPSFSDIANEYKLKNLKNLKRVSELHEPAEGPEKPSLRFLMNNYRERMMKEYSEKYRKEIGIPTFMPLIPKIPVLLQNKLAERNHYWTCHDTYYNHGILIFSHYRVPCVQIKMMFDLFDETEFGEFKITNIVPMMSKTKIISSTFELIQHLQFFKRVPSDMKNMCRHSNEIINFLENLDSKIIKKNYDEVQKLKEIVVSTNSKIWHENETGKCGITKSLIYNRNIYDIIIKISDLQITDISDVTVKPYVMPTNKVKDLSQGIDFIRTLLEKPRNYLNFYE